MTWEYIPGWFSFAHAYDEMVETAEDGDVIVEVGVAFGKSVAYLARKVIESKKDIIIYAVDPWCGGWDGKNVGAGWGGEHAQRVKDAGGPFNAFLREMRLHAPQELEIVNVLRCYSSEAAGMIGTAHGVLIDANHDYPDVALDIHMWGMVVGHPGSIMAGDDYHKEEFPGVVRAVHEAFTDVEVKGTTWLKRF